MSYLLLKSMLISNAEKRKTKVKKSKVKKCDRNEICRTCNFEPASIPIFDNEAHPKIAEDILHFSGVQISESDAMSKMMCQNCLFLLESCIMFRDMCQITNKALLESQVTVKKEPDYLEFGPVPIYQSDDSYNLSSPEFPEFPSAVEPTEADEIVWKCEECNEIFYEEKIYDKHVAKCKRKGPIDKSIRRFLCDICGKTSHSNANLLAHMFTHDNVFQFKCELCPYQGRTQDLLNVHKRTHLPEKPYKCIHCPKTTTTSSNLAKHMRHVHSTTRPFKCNYCDKAFSYQHDMKRHVKDIHLRQGTVQCDVCFKKFNTRKILQGHRWKIHKIKGDKQGRMPSYLQCQAEDATHTSQNNANNCNQEFHYDKEKTQVIQE